MCGLLQYSLYGTRDAAQNWEKELALTLSDLKIVEGKCVPVRVDRLQQRRGHRGNCARRRHHNRWRTISDGFLIKNESRKYEIKKQVIGEDPDLEKSGTKMNRVIERNHDGITIEADQRHVREILKHLELVRGSHSATPCAVEREDESKEENRCGRGQTQTEHEWDDVNDLTTRTNRR